MRGTDLPPPPLHVLQLHAHRRGDARRGPVLRRRRGLGARLRRARRRDPRCGRAGRRVRRHRVRARSPTTGWKQNDPSVTGDWDVVLPRGGSDVPRRGLRLPLLRRDAGPRRAAQRARPRSRPPRGTGPAVARGVALARFRRGSPPSRRRAGAVPPPTSTSRPTIERTICQQNALARIS